jgi:hypothetical protein
MYSYKYEGLMVCHMCWFWQLLDRAHASLQNDSAICCAPLRLTRVKLHASTSLLCFFVSPSEHGNDPLDTHHGTRCARSSDSCQLVLVRALCIDLRRYRSVSRLGRLLLGISATHMLCNAQVTQLRLSCSQLKAQNALFHLHSSLYSELLTNDGIRASRPYLCLVSHDQNLCGLIDLDAWICTRELCTKLTPSEKTWQFCFSRNSTNQSNKCQGPKSPSFTVRELGTSPSRQIRNNITVDLCGSTRRMTLADGSRLGNPTRAAQVFHGCRFLPCSNSSSRVRP